MYIPWLKSSVSSYLDLIWHIIRRGQGTEEDTSPGSLSSWLGWGKRSTPTSGAKGASKINSIARPPLWALIIGINDYPEKSNMTKLKGAVPDADSIDQYLQSELKVPSKQIWNLRDAQATRSGIIAALERLRDNPDIQKGDPILVYYAGHGGEIPIKGIQTIIPVDYIPEKVPPIPDKTVAALINGIARKKGNNITLIFDCCHSGSGARGEEDEESTVRGGELHPNDAPDGLDAAIYAANPSPPTRSDTRGFRVARGFADHGMNSHVLLAACSASELAREDKKLGGVARGRFTAALLEMLRTVMPDQVTYFEALTRMPHIDGQNPQVEGFFQRRVFFDAKVVPPTRNAFDLKIEKGKFVLQAGRAHGITDGAEFTIYKDKDAVPDFPLGVMVAKDKKIKGFTTDLEASGVPPVIVDNLAVAIQSKIGASDDLTIHVPMESQYLPVFEAVAKEMDGTGPELCRLKLVERSEAKLGIVADKKQIAFDVLENRAKEHGFTRLPYKIDCVVDDIHRVLRAASHYHFHLNLDHPNSQIKKGVKIEFFALDEEQDEDGEDILVPIGKDLHKAGKIELEVDDDDERKYGMRITNNSPFNLHFACLFFDHADLSITAMTEMAAKNGYKKDPTLPTGSTAEMGFGRLGIPPFECYIPEGLDIDLGFLKFYFTEEAVDLSHIPQVTPFTATRGLKPSMDRKNVWGTILIPVVMKRS